MLGLGLGCVGAGLCWMVLGAGLSWDCVIVGVGFGWSGVKEWAGVGLEWVGVGLEWVGSWAGVELDLGWVCSCLCTQAKMPQKNTTYICAGPCPLCHDPCDSYGILWKHYDGLGWLPHSIMYYHGSLRACVRHYLD